jgi:hypothetical protein
MIGSASDHREVADGSMIFTSLQSAISEILFAASAIKWIVSHERINQLIKDCSAAQYGFDWQCFVLSHALHILLRSFVESTRTKGLGEITYGNFFVVEEWPIY